jgi:CRP-like cAMP-binding protein
MRSYDFSDNALLAQLPDAVARRLSGDAELVEMRAGTVLYDIERHPGHVYFILDGVVSLVHLLSNGDTGEVAMVGCEGIVGVSLLVDSRSIPSRALVQVPGHALASSLARVHEEFRLGGLFQTLILRYSQALIAQMAQLTMCARRHTVEQQLVRWLLSCFDRSKLATLRLTHESIAQALCVRRVSVTEAMSRLQEAGLVDNGRGSIRVLDQAGLAARGCECFDTIREQTHRLLFRPRPATPDEARGWEEVSALGLQHDGAQDDGVGRDTRRPAFSRARSGS